MVRIVKKKGTVEKRSVGLIVEKLRDREVLELVCAVQRLSWSPAVKRNLEGMVTGISVDLTKCSELFRESSVGLLDDDE